MRRKPWVIAARSKSTKRCFTSRNSLNSFFSTSCPFFSRQISLNDLFNLITLHGLKTRNSRCFFVVLQSDSWLKQKWCVVWACIFTFSTPRQVVGPLRRLPAPSRVAMWPEMGGVRESCVKLIYFVKWGLGSNDHQKVITIALPPHQSAASGPPTEGNPAAAAVVVDVKFQIWWHNSDIWSRGPNAHRWSKIMQGKNSYANSVTWR